MNRSLPNAKSSSYPAERESIRLAVATQNLCGLANDTKWDEFISAMRARSDWRPRYRWKCVDGVPSRWDVEWIHHLPLPMISVEWFDLLYLQETREKRLPPRLHITDHSIWIEPLLKSIGLEYQKGQTMIRIFGYSPKSLELFDNPD
jgi:hypothetical protein